MPDATGAHRSNNDSNSWIMDSRDLPTPIHFTEETEKQSKVLIWVVLFCHRSQVCV
ncbi:hypothetical protein NQZ68_003213 [Dissostichus eleginoides]|nr:hypothetical protein NQZ68_003213 [Dissostichus eleginoides]